MLDPTVNGERISSLRSSAASTVPASSYFRLTGEDVFDVVDRLVTTDLYLQEAQLRQCLVLDREGLVVADGVVGRDDDAYLLVLDGPSHDACARLVAEHVKGTATTVEDLAASYEPVGIHGPYAWELVGEWLGPDLVGLPYLSLFRQDGALVLRTGRTGEYGYDVLMPKAKIEALRAGLAKTGAVFDLSPIDRDGLDLAALENGFFNIEREGKLVRDPLMLQLKWRMSKDKAFVGSQPLLSRWTAGVSKRVTWLTSEQPIADGAAVELEGERIGTIVNSARSPIRRKHVGLALLDLHYAQAGIDGYVAVGGGGAAKISTVAPPILNNLSLYVSPQRHSYRDRAGFFFPEP